MPRDGETPRTPHFTRGRPSDGSSFHPSGRPKATGPCTRVRAEDRDNGVQGLPPSATRPRLKMPTDMESPVLLRQVRRVYPDQYYGRTAEASAATVAGLVKGLARPKEAILDLTYKFCLMGMKVADLARLFEVNVKTIHDWVLTKPGFADAMRQGREIADANVAKSLYHRATGYDYEVEKIFVTKAGAIIKVPTVAHMPADVAAAKHWLGNRVKDKWSGDNTYMTPDGTTAPVPVIVINPVSVAPRAAGTVPAATADADQELEPA